VAYSVTEFVVAYCLGATRYGISAPSARYENVTFVTVGKGRKRNPTLERFFRTWTQSSTEDTSKWKKKKTYRIIKNSVKLGAPWKPLFTIANKFLPAPPHPTPRVQFGTTELYIIFFKYLCVPRKSAQANPQFSYWWKWNYMHTCSVKTYVILKVKSALVKSMQCVTESAVRHAVSLLGDGLTL